MPEDPSYQEIFQRIQEDQRYLTQIEWGEPRPGHPEGTVKAHLDELEQNRLRFGQRFSATDHCKLQILIHTHDTFKAVAREGVAITHPDSHASLARTFLAEFCDDLDLLNMVQLHDEPYALWRQATRLKGINQARWKTLLGSIVDWDLFLAFLIIDGCTAGKGRDKLHWFFSEVAGRVTSQITAADILE